LIELNRYLDEFEDIEKPKRDEIKELKYYSLERFLVLCSVLNSEKIRGNKNIQKKLQKYIKDSYFQKWIQSLQKNKVF